MSVSNTLLWSIQTSSMRDGSRPVMKTRMRLKISTDVHVLIWSR